MESAVVTRAGMQQIQYPHTPGGLCVSVIDVQTSCACFYLTIIPVVEVDDVRDVEVSSITVTKLLSSACFSC